MPNAVTIRLAQQKDAGQVTDLINAAFALVERFFIDSDRINLEEVNAFLRSGQFLLAEDEGSVVACAYLEQQGDHTYLGLLSVDPSRQGSGLGSLLMNAAEAYGKKIGSRFMDVKVVNLRTELLPYYRKRGYIDTGTSPFPEDIKTKLPCWFIEMSKPLS